MYLFGKNYSFLKKLVVKLRHDSFLFTISENRLWITSITSIGTFKTNFKIYQIEAIKPLKSGFEHEIIPVLVVYTCVNSDS